MARRDNPVEQANDNSGLSIGALMRIYRQQSGVTLTDLSRMLDFTKGYLSAVENGKARPSHRLIESYEKALNLDPQTLSAAIQDTSSSLGSEEISSTSGRTSKQAEKLPGKPRSPYGLPRDLRKSGVKPRADWAGAPSVDMFVGRETELSLLRKWIAQDNCRLVVLIGSGGVGKTMLATKVGKDLTDGTTGTTGYQYIFWRSLHDAPTLRTLIHEWFAFVSGTEVRDDQVPPTLRDAEDINALITRFMNMLHERRCLMILDNFESLFETQDASDLSLAGAGIFKEGLSDYKILLDQLSEARLAQRMPGSCVLITSREKPAGILADDDAAASSSVHVMRLGGLRNADARALLDGKGLIGNDEEWKQFIDQFSGIPLILNLVSATVRSLFRGQIASFIRSGAALFGSAYELLDQQFERLNRWEEIILYWLAIEREGASLADLLDDVVPLPPTRIAIEALDSLRRRSMIEVSGQDIYILQPVVLDFVTQRLVDRVCEEIERGHSTTETGQPMLLETHALAKALSRESVRKGQIQSIVRPIADRLVASLGQNTLRERLMAVLDRDREKHGRIPRPGYLAGNVLTILIQAGCGLRGCDFSYTSIWQADLRDVRLPSVNFTSSDFAKTVFSETFGTVSSLAFGRGPLASRGYLASGTGKGEIRIWDASTGRPLHSCYGHDDWVTSVAFSPDGTVLASGSNDRTVRLWDPETGKTITALLEHPARVTSLAFSPDGQLLVSGCNDGRLHVWCALTGDRIRILAGHLGHVLSVAFSPDGRLLASGSADHTVRLWDPQTGEHVTTLAGEQGHTDRVNAVAFSPDGRLLASGSEDRTIRLWDVKSRRPLATIVGHTEQVNAVAFSPDGRLLASGSEDRTIRLWDVKSRDSLAARELGGTDLSHTAPVTALAFSPDGQLASGSEDQSVRLWDVGANVLLRTLVGTVNWVWSVAFSPDQEDMLLAVGGEDQVVRLWDLESDKERYQLVGHTNWIGSLAFNPDGKLLASSGGDRTVRIWDVNTGARLRILTQLNDWIFSVVFSPDGNWLAGGSEDTRIAIWDVTTGQLVKMIQAHDDAVNAVAFSPDGRLLASGSADHTVRLWDPQTGEHVTTLAGHDDAVKSVAFSPDGQLLASGSADHTVRLWDPQTGECVTTLAGEQGHTDRVNAVAFSPDGRLLASGSADHTVRLWDVGRRARVASVADHEGWVNSLAFSPNGELLASGSDDGTARVMEIGVIRLRDRSVDGSAQSHIIRSERVYEGMNIIDATGLTDGQKRALVTLGAHLETQLK